MIRNLEEILPDGFKIPSIKEYHIVIEDNEYLEYEEYYLDW